MNLIDIKGDDSPATGKFYLFIKLLALDHKNNPARPSIKPWQTKVSRLYSSNSNRTQIAVATPRTPPDIFLFLHRSTSAAAPQNNMWSISDQNNGTCGKTERDWK